MASLSNSKNDPKLETEFDGLINREKMSGVERENKEGEEFDHGAPPPFQLADIRAAIPKHCWVKDPWKSMSYVVRDVIVIFALMIVAGYLDSWVVWPFYWFAQGILFCALFAIGHDCGHGSFSNNNKLNDVVGHILHSSIFVPYHAWRISHKLHHANHAHADNDETWRPFSETTYRSMSNLSRMFRYTAPFPLFLFPYYLVMREPGKKGSHFHPKSDIFSSSEQLDVLTSIACWSVMVALLAGLCFIFGPIPLLKLYGVPYVVFVMWFAFVSYMQHHGQGEERLPYYRRKEWNHLRGALSTLERDYGVFDYIHHNLGTHILHHLFPQIPHYHLVEATEAAKPVLGKYYKEAQRSKGPFPFHLIGSFLLSLRVDHFISNTGDIVYFQTDPALTMFGASKS